MEGLDELKQVLEFLKNDWTNQPRETARKAIDLLTQQIARVEKLAACIPHTNGPPRYSVIVRKVRDLAANQDENSTIEAIQLLSEKIADEDDFLQMTDDFIDELIAPKK